MLPDDLAAFGASSSESVWQCRPSVAIQTADPYIYESQLS
jgi:hypothetical protein